MSSLFLRSTCRRLANSLSRLEVTDEMLIVRCSYLAEEESFLRPLPVSALLPQCRCDQERGDAN